MAWWRATIFAPDIQKISTVGELQELIQIDVLIHGYTFSPSGLQAYFWIYLHLEICKRTWWLHQQHRAVKPMEPERNHFWGGPDPPKLVIYSDNQRHGEWGETTSETNKSPVANEKMPQSMVHEGDNNT
jgi:hypothetical protein